MDLLPDTDTKEYITEIKNLKAQIKALETDTEEHRKAKEALAESEKMYRTIFEHTGTATILIDEDKIIQMVNSKFEDLCGYKRHEIEGKLRWTNFIQEIDHEMMEEFHHSRRINPDSAPKNYECRPTNKMGEDLIAMMTVGLIPGTKQSIASISNITEERNAQLALKLSEEKFSKVFRSSPQAILISTLSEGRIVDANDTFCEATGYLKKQVLGMTTDELGLLPNSKPHANLSVFLQKNRKLRNVEVVYKMKSGETRIGNMSAEIIDINGQECIISAAIDITKQRDLEKEILRISQEERQKIGYDLHDDLGQHLIGIEALSTLLKQRLHDKNHPDAELAAEISKLIRDATTKTRNLAKGLCPVDLDAGGLASSLTIFSEHIKKVFRISCRLDFDTDFKIEDNTIATNLYHIVQEAVNNALRHGKADRIILSIKKVSHGAKLSIIDNGCGFKEKAEDQGLGHKIMLYRARSIGASLKISSTENEGTRVTCLINQKYL